MTTADQTNAEVSDERLREIIDGLGADTFAGITRTVELKMPEARAILTDLLTRRSVTSQASEGADDKRQKYADAIAKLHGRDLDLYFGMGKFADGVTDEQKRAAMLAFFFPKAPASPVSKRVERLETLKECATIAHTAHLQCVDERDRIRQNTPEFGYAQAKVDAVTAVWHRINELLPKEPSSGQALQGGRS